MHTHRTGEGVLAPKPLIRAVYYEPMHNAYRSLRNLCVNISMSRSFFLFSVLFLRFKIVLSINSFAFSVVETLDEYYTK